MSPSMAELIEAVKAHADKHYDEGGWDVVVECYTDRELQEWLESTEYGATVPTTVEEAVARVASAVGIWADWQADAAFHRRQALGDEA
ncbi:hypothetical protein ACFXAF_00380 [Kitasatospora sp. NPDC059463]|uniref:hypothetical protein n=1 Tax=unclassified Kitasatospora TaxID=2633591 RepID=UPI00368C05D7